MWRGSKNSNSVGALHLLITWLAPLVYGSRFRYDLKHCWQLVQALLPYKLSGHCFLLFKGTEHVKWRTFKIFLCWLNTNIREQHSYLKPLHVYQYICCALHLHIHAVDIVRTTEGICVALADMLNNEFI